MNDTINRLSRPLRSTLCRERSSIKKALVATFQKQVEKYKFGNIVGRAGGRYIVQRKMLGNTCRYSQQGEQIARLLNKYQTGKPCIYVS
jgi:hypothetical protein